jgi:hypothetical protein
MTKKQYRSAMGKTVDMGALLLQNEDVRAVGNMGVNSRGDVINSNNKVIEKKSRQIQRQNSRKTNVNHTPVTTSTSALNKKEKPTTSVSTIDNVFETIDPVTTETQEPVSSGGLAAAIARSRTVKQELEKTLQERNQETTGVRKI